MAVFPEQDGEVGGIEDDIAMVGDIEMATFGSSLLIEGYARGGLFLNLMEERDDDGLIYKQTGVGGEAEDAADEGGYEPRQTDTCRTANHAEHVGVGKYTLSGLSNLYAFVGGYLTIFCRHNVVGFRNR